MIFITEILTRCYIISFKKKKILFMFVGSVRGVEYSPRRKWERSKLAPVACSLLVTELVNWRCGNGWRRTRGQLLECRLKNKEVLYFIFIFSCNLWGITWGAMEVEMYCRAMLAFAYWSSVVFHPSTWSQKNSYWQCSCREGSKLALPH